jgi:hypothetical protein
MSVVINTNYAATIASNNLSAANSSLQKSLNRLSSGSRIVSPADDAGGLAVSMKLSAGGEALRRCGCGSHQFVIVSAATGWCLEGRRKGSGAHQ